MRKLFNPKYLAVPVALAALLTLGMVRPASAQIDLNIGGGLLNLGVGDSFWGAPAVTTYPSVIDNSVVAPDIYGVNTFPAVVAPDTDFDLW